MGVTNAGHGSMGFPKRKERSVKPTGMASTYLTLGS